MMSSDEQNTDRVNTIMISLSQNAHFFSQRWSVWILFPVFETKKKHLKYSDNIIVCHILISNNVQTKVKITTSYRFD